MTMLTLAATLRRTPRACSANVEHLLDPSGARVVLGDHVGADGIPPQLAPARTTMFGPRGVAFSSEGLIVADTGHHRLLFWRRLPDRDNQAADFVIGQPDFFSEGRNARGLCGAATFDMPTGVASNGITLAVADAWNHRVLIWRTPPQRDNQPADIVLGQSDFTGCRANRGGEAGPDTLNWSYGVTIAGERLLVADTGNRRVLVWNSIPDRHGQPADLVLGQSDMRARDDNAGEAAGAEGMRWPHAIVVHEGRILIADAGNSRIMVWPSMPNADGAPCAFVLGQESLHRLDHNRANSDPDERSLSMPYGLAALGDTLVCADTANSRLLAFPLSKLAPNLPAEALSGQRSFADKGDNRWRFAARDSVCWPFAIASRGDLAAVADTGNNRVLLWERVT